MEILQLYCKTITSQHSIMKDEVLYQHDDYKKKKFDPYHDDDKNNVKETYITFKLTTLGQNEQRNGTFYR